MIKKIVLLTALTLFSSLFADSSTTENFTLGKGTLTKTGTDRGIVTKFSGNNKTANNITVKTETKDLLELNTQFNCATGEVDLSAVAQDIPRELQAQFEKLFSDTTSILEELAYQEATEFLLDEMAIIHYNMTKDAGDSALESFSSLSLVYTSQCVSATLAKSFEMSLEAGAGFNIYDLFSGKFGINVTELISVVKCLRNSKYDNLDDASKEKFEASKRWVRHLFYKILNESMSINIKTKTEDCKELDREKNKRDEIGYNLACKGVFTDLSGNETRVEISGKEVVTGVKKNTFKQQTEKANSRTKRVEEAKKDTEKKEANKGKVLTTSEFEYEGVISKTPFFNIKPDSIDLLDFDREERYAFNLYIYLKVKEAIEARADYNTDKVAKASLAAILKALSISKVDKEYLNMYKCSYVGTPNETCKEEDFPNYKDMSYAERRTEVKKVYESKLKEQALKLNFLSTGMISDSDYNQIKRERLEFYGKGVDNSDLEKEILKKAKANLDYWDHIKNFVAAGSHKIFIDKYAYFDKDISKIYDYIDNNPDKINNGILLMQSTHELETIRSLYNYSQNIVKAKLLLATKTLDKDYVISQDINDLTDNFSFIDKNKFYVLSKTPQYLGFTTKELEEIVFNIDLAKKIYITEYTEVLMNRMNAIRAWLYNFDKKNYGQNDAMIQMQKMEVEKITLKIKQRKKILSLMQ